MNQLPIVSVTQCIAIFNQVIELTQPLVLVEGEISNYKISRNRWIYFDLKDETSKVRCFGSTMQLPAPLEEGMLIKITAQPHLHPQYGFTLNILAIELSGEGTINRAFKLLEGKLEREGLFDEARKRPLPYPPQKIALITSKESAAYKDFIKIINSRWGGIEIMLFDVYVQGAKAANEVTKALEIANTDYDNDVIVVTRGGGSVDDLQAFSNEVLVRAIASSRTPTIVAIGHEVDFSLAERAADVRASTPSNAAELLVPEKAVELRIINSAAKQLNNNIVDMIKREENKINEWSDNLLAVINARVNEARNLVNQKNTLLDSFNPDTVLKRGYAIVFKNDHPVLQSTQLNTGDNLQVILKDWKLNVKIMSKERNDG